LKVLLTFDGDGDGVGGGEGRHRQRGGDAGGPLRKHAAGAVCAGLQLAIEVVMGEGRADGDERVEERERQRTGLQAPARGASVALISY
jgi:hypothetical protein